MRLSYIAILTAGPCFLHWMENVDGSYAWRPWPRCSCCNVMSAPRREYLGKGASPIPRPITPIELKHVMIKGQVMVWSW